MIEPSLVDHLRALLRADPTITLGVVTKVYRLAGVRRVHVRLHSTGATVSARVYTLGGAGRVAVTAGAEAVVLFPDGSHTRAIALVEPENGRNKQTQDEVGIELTHPDGAAVRRERGASVEPAVLARWVDDVVAYHQALTSGLTAVQASLASGGAPTVATLSAALAAASTALGTLVANLNASNVATQGPLPEATNPYKAKALKTE